MCGSASWTKVLLPNQVTVPSPPLLKSPATGTTVKTSKAGTIETVSYTHLRAHET